MLPAMKYTVAGFSKAEIRKLMAFSAILLRHSSSLRYKGTAKHHVLMHSIDLADHKGLSAEFGQFDLFILMNEAALDACRIAGYNIKVLRELDETELTAEPIPLVRAVLWS